MRLKIFNTDTRKLETFVPLNKEEVGLYCCGPTVYNYAHIGNLRTYIFEDILRRILERDGYFVKHVMNITDVGHLTDDGDDGEDKMIKSSREKGMSVWDIAQFFTDAFFDDTTKLNIKKPSISCKATDHIGNMISLIKKLEEKGFTYFSGGNVYFDISKFAQYGKMALRDKQELQAGARIVIDKNKKNPHDFVLWFTDSKFEQQAMVWDSPWGRGYPGWHIECSAMSMKYLGDKFDIHCGGIDHIPVHHTNEIAQSEAATGKKWVNYWIHGEFLVLNSGKMSKSGGGFITLYTLIEKGYDPLDYRYFCLGAHYRTQLKFSYESLDAAATARKKIITKFNTMLENSCGIIAGNIQSTSLLAILDDFNEDCNTDMNMPRALSRLFSVIKDDSDDKEKLAALIQINTVLSIGLSEIKYNPKQEELPLKLQKIILEREESRKNKDFEESDRLRDILIENGISIKDGQNGTVWSYIKK